MSCLQKVSGRKEKGINEFPWINNDFGFHSSLSTVIVLYFLSAQWLTWIPSSSSSSSSCWRCPCSASDRLPPMFSFSLPFTFSLRHVQQQQPQQQPQFVPLQVSQPLKAQSKSISRNERMHLSKFRSDKLSRDLHECLCSPRWLSSSFSLSSLSLSLQLLHRDTTANTDTHIHTPLRQLLTNQQNCPSSVIVE